MEKAHIDSLPSWAQLILWDISMTNVFPSSENCSFLIQILWHDFQNWGRGGWRGKDFITQFIHWKLCKDSDFSTINFKGWITLWNFGPAEILISNDPTFMALYQCSVAPFNSQFREEWELRVGDARPDTENNRMNLKQTFGNQQRLDTTLSNMQQARLGRCCFPGNFYFSQISFVMAQK